MSPEQVAAEEGFHVLAWVGDYFQIPTVGVVVDPTHIPLDSPALLGVVRANQLALRLIAEHPDRGVDYLTWFLDRLTRDEAQRYFDRYVGPYFLADRKVNPDMTQRSIDAVATELGVATTRSRRLLRTTSHKHLNQEAEKPWHRTKI